MSRHTMIRICNQCCNFQSFEMYGKDDYRCRQCKYQFFEKAINNTDYLKLDLNDSIPYRNAFKRMQSIRYFPLNMDEFKQIEALMVEMFEEGFKYKEGYEDASVQ